MLQTTKYSYLSTLELIKKITQNDIYALNHFLTNRKVVLHGGTQYSIPKFLQVQRSNNFYPIITPHLNEKHFDIKLDYVYDKTLQKFSILQTNKDLIDGPFCNRQYEVILEKLEEYLNTGTNYKEIDTELKGEEIIKQTIYRHINYSWLEVCRSSNRLYKRYRWELPTGTIELKKPQHIDGRSFTKWLNEHLEKPNPKDKNEKLRIQKIIDDWFGLLNEVDTSNVEYKLKDKNDPYDEIEKYPEDFATMIASEKASNIGGLRPSIRGLGKQKIFSLVKKILESIQHDELKDSEIQKEFGLAKSTYSRFAGGDWKNKNNGEVPDLWKNIAAIVLKDPTLSELTVSLGIGENMKVLLDNKEYKNEK